MENYNLEKLYKRIEKEENIIWKEHPFQGLFIPSFHAIHYGIIILFLIIGFLIFNLSYFELTPIERFYYDVKSEIFSGNSKSYLYTIGFIVSVLLIIIGIKNWFDRLRVYYIITEDNLYIRYKFLVHRLSFSNIRDISIDTRQYGRETLSNIYITQKVFVDPKIPNLYNFNFQKITLRIEIEENGIKIYDFIKNKLENNT